MSDCDEQPGEATPLALYVHWPFCVVKCPYCDFNSHVRDDVDHGAWRQALLDELRYEAERTRGHRLTSVFFGGGTPSLMDPRTVEAVIAEARDAWPVADDLEITLEANPNSAEAARFADLALAGVNRLSLGLQRMDDASLRFLGRAHDAAEGLAALEAAQSAVERVSFDLIFALPDDTLDSVTSLLGRAIGLGTEHLSLYQLTIEPGTRFESDVRKGKFAPLEEETAAAIFEATQDITEAAGISAYEISNHARPGAESRHNLAYWRYRPYVGIGPGAHGRRGGMRTFRHRKPENYLSSMRRNGHALREEETLGAREMAHEALVMGLRLTEGIEPADLARRSGVETIVDQQAVDRLIAQGLLAQEGPRLRLRPPGRLLLDAILAEIAV